MVKKDRIENKTVHARHEDDNEKKLFRLRQTVNTMFFSYHLSRRAIARELDVSRTFVIRSPHLKKNLYVQEVEHETVDVYRQGRVALKKKGYTIKAIVLDGRPGVRQIFSDIPVQMCHFHQKQIITRYLTNNPKLEAGIELKKLTKTLCETNEDDFVSAIHSWYNTWSLFLKERTIYQVTGRRHLYPTAMKSAHSV